MRSFAAEDGDGNGTFPMGFGQYGSRRAVMRSRLIELETRWRGQKPTTTLAQMGPDAEVAGVVDYAGIATRSVFITNRSSTE